MLESFYQLDAITGININVSRDSAVVINACSITIKKQQVNLEQKITSCNSLSDLKTKVSSICPVALNLTGKGILHKQTDRISEVNAQNFGLILPNANINDFYVQNFIQGAYSFISAIRKTDADRWVKELTSLGFTPLMLSLGPFSVFNIMPQLNIYSGDIVFNGHIIKVDEQQNWLKYEANETAKASFMIKVDTEKIDEALVLPYAAAFQLYAIGKIAPIHAEVGALNSAYLKLLENKKFKAWGILLLSVIFMLLLLNFIAFSYLSSANNELSSRISRTTQSTNDIQQVTEQIARKEALLKKLGWEDNLNKSILIDQVSSLLPVELTLTQLDIDPLDIMASRFEKTVVFSNRRIKITGNSEKIIPVNEWIARIKSRSWVKNAQLDSYTYNNELNTGQFVVLIDY